MDKNATIDQYLDLRGFSCPVNFVKCCIALEKLSINQVLKVDLDLGEAETSVIEGLKERGYNVKIYDKNSKKVTLLILSE